MPVSVPENCPRAAICDRTAVLSVSSPAELKRSSVELTSITARLRRAGGQLSWEKINVLDPITTRLLLPPTHPQKPAWGVAARRLLRGFLREGGVFDFFIRRFEDQCASGKVIRNELESFSRFSLHCQKTRLWIELINCLPPRSSSDNPMIPWCSWCLGGELGGRVALHLAYCILHPGGRVVLPSFNLKKNCTFALDVYI
jgi:hypothetical protein